MAKRREPNKDASGNDLAGQEISYNLSTGDAFVLGGLTYTVADSYPNGVRTIGGEEFTYRELKRRGAFFAKL
jgi:hypothetical protein